MAEAIADAESKAAEKAEASRPPKGIMAWLNEVSSTPGSATDPPEPTPSKQAKQIAGTLREWLDIVKSDEQKYGSLEAKNPVVSQT